MTNADACDKVALICICTLKEGRMEDIQLMQQAIALAKKGKGHVNPNPLVGAVLVKDGTIIGKGYHEQYGQLHA